MGLAVGGGPWGAAAGAVAGAAFGVIGAKATNKANKASENQRKNAQDDLIIENRRRATHDYLKQVRLEQLQGLQENEAITEKAFDITKQEIGAAGQARASAAERGVAGNSVETIVNDYEFQQNQEVGRLRQNQAMKDAQHVEVTGGSRDQFDQRVAAVQPYVPRQQPPVDYFGPIFAAASTAAAAFRGGGPSGTLPGAGAAPKPPLETASNNYNNFGVGK